MLVAENRWGIETFYEHIIRIYHFFGQIFGSVPQNEWLTPSLLIDSKSRCIPGPVSASRCQSLHPSHLQPSWKESFLSAAVDPHLGHPSQLSCHCQRHQDVYMRSLQPALLFQLSMSEPPSTPHHHHHHNHHHAQNRTRPHFMPREALNLHRRGRYICDR